MKLVILSDLHLTQPGERLDGIDPHQRLATAIDRINAVHADADLVVLAGDLTDRARTVAYEALRKALKGLRPPWTATLGNHDNRDVFARVFGEAHLDARGFAQSAHAFGNHVVLVLDSVKKGPSNSGWAHVEGAVCDVRLTWLAEQLKAAGERSVTLVLHHPILPISPAHDAYLLEEPERLLAVLDGYENVRTVVAGHVHMTTLVQRRGVAFVTLAGGHTTSQDNFGQAPLSDRRAGPGQLAVVEAGTDVSRVYFDNYVDDHGILD